MNDSRSDVTMGHEYDGIQEYDNRLPNWWLFTLYGSIVFSVGYWLFFHTFGIGHTQEQSLAREERLAAEAQLQREMGQEVTEESLVLMTKIPAQVEAGQKIYQQKCAQCHGSQGAGEIGPNLTDDAWLHGPYPLQIHGTVMNGVVDKGMQAWKDQLGPVRVRQVVAYLMTIQGSNLSGKSPQGRATAEWSLEREAAATNPAGSSSTSPAGG